MITDSIPRYVSQGTNVPDEDVSQFDTAYRRQELLSSVRSEERATVESLNADYNALILQYPDKKDIIETYAKPERDFGGVISGYAANTQETAFARGRRDTMTRMFNNGDFYRDEAGVIVGNQPHTKEYAEKFQDHLQPYFAYRELTDGTEYDIEKQHARTIAYVQEQLIDLNEKRSKSKGAMDMTASILGGMGFAITEPEMVPFFFTGGASVGAGLLGNAAKSFAIEAGASMAADAAMKPTELAWRRQLADPKRGIEMYTTWDAVKDVLFNAGFAGALRGTGSLVVDGRIVMSTNKSDFEFMDNIAGILQGTDVIRTTGTSTSGAAAKASELRDEVDEIVSSSPEADIDAHVSNVDRALDGEDLGTQIYKSNAEAVSGDFIVTPDGRVARVTASTEDELTYLDAEGNPTSFDRSAVSPAPETITVEEPANVSNVDIGAADHVTEGTVTSTINAHIADPEIKYFTESMDELEMELRRLEATDEMCN